jgi:hypothetical protein
MERYQDFKQSLDRFGRQLALLGADRKNMAELRQIVESSIRPETEAPETESHERDLRSLVQNTLFAIEAGKLKPSDHGLEESGRDFLKNLDTLTSNRFGDKGKGYEDLSGLTANIPGREILDRKEVGRLLSPLHETDSQLRKLLEEDLKFSDKKAVVEELKGLKEELYPILEGAPGNPVRQLRQVEKAIAGAGDLGEMVNSIQEMRALLQHLENSQIGKILASDGEQEYRSLRAEYNRTQTRGIAPGWDAFLSRLESEGR